MPLQNTLRNTSDPIHDKRYNEFLQNIEREGAGELVGVPLNAEVLYETVSAPLLPEAS